MAAGADEPGCSSEVTIIRPELQILAAGGFRCIRLLGRGQYGTAHLVECTDKPGEPEQVVAKVVFLDHLKDKDRALALQEVELLKRLKHPNVVQHHTSFLHHRGTTPHTGEALVNVMEYCAGGDLRVWLENCAAAEERLPEESVLSLFVQMLKGVGYVHSCRILHRDLKTSNMLLDQDHRIVKVGDFGIARVLESTTAVAATMLGTPYYMSPEVCKGEPYRDKSDMWSLGCVLYEMCRFRHAFESQSLLGLVYCIVSEHYDPIPDVYASEVSELVGLLLAKNADERPTAEQALALPVLQPYSSAEPLEFPEPAFGRTAPAAIKVIEEDSSPPPPPPEELVSEGPRPPPSPWSQVSSTMPGTRPGELAAKPLPPKRVVAAGQPPPPPPGPGVSTASSWRPRTQAVGARGARQNVEISDEVQVILARARQTLLRRPRAKGNWVQAFARHDTTGLGELSPEQFATFLQSLSVGLSLREVDLIVACLLGDRPTVSLAVFGEAIEHALSTGETDAVLLATELAGESAEGLAALVGQHPVDAVTSLATSPDPDALHRFLLWLPKNLDGSVDWATAEEWRASSVKSSKAG